MGPCQLTGRTLVEKLIGSSAKLVDPLAGRLVGCRRESWWPQLVYPPAEIR